MPKRSLKKKVSSGRETEVRFDSPVEARQFELRLAISGVSYKTTISKTKTYGVVYIVTVYDMHHNLNSIYCWCNPIYDHDSQLIIHHRSMH